MYQKEAEELAEKYGYLPETIQRFISIFGLDETKKMLTAYEKPPATTIRVNTLKIKKEELIKRLTKKGFTMDNMEWYDNGLIINKQPFSIGSTTEYLSGYYFIQSKASWLPVLLLNPKPGDIIIDLAAAPGGKATHIAERMNNKGTLICIDISRERIKSLRSNLTRCGISNTICYRMDSQDIIKLGIKADGILLDAPCSGEGLMAIDHERRKARNLDDITRMKELQKNLFVAGLKALKKNGILVYSTCSTAPEENEEIIDWALSKYPIKIIEHNYKNFRTGLIKNSEKNYHSDLKKAIRLYPHTDDSEGFFACKIQLEEEIS
ncbi:MAG: RsmB/NOP family class I SAM-dependent RNA methyltransferase [Candidatus Thorarchaeota archaeon]